MNKLISKPKQFVKFLPAIVAASAIQLTCNAYPETPEFNPGKEIGLQAKNEKGGISVISGDYLLTLAHPGTIGDVEKLLAEIGITTGKVTPLGRGVFSLTGLTEVQAKKLSENPKVATLEADQELTLHSSDKNTTSYAADDAQILSWGVSRIGSGDGAAVARTAWVVDSGVQLDHPDLNVDVQRSRSFLPYEPNPADEFGHGTQVAGILAAKDNDFGVSGVAAGATVVSLKVMDKTGRGNVGAVIAALEYIAEHGKPGDVVNLSLGSSPSETLDNAALAVAKKGIFVVIAAGNLGKNAEEFSPARVNHPNIFTVSAMKPDNTYMSVSNWGTPVDYCAPGSRLTSTRMNGLYGNAAGTSMAAPHLSGLLLLKGNNIKTQGTVENDPDGKPDPIPVL